MERPKRTATKVVNYRTFHLSGDLNTTLQGRVGQVINQWGQGNTMSELPDNASAEQIREALEKQKREESQQKEELECFTLRNEYEAGLLRKRQWQAAKEQLQEARERMNREHEEGLLKLKDMAQQTDPLEVGKVQAWLSQQLGTGTNTETITQEQKRQEEEKQQMLKELQEQQQQISDKIRQITGEKDNQTEDILSLLRKELAQGDKTTAQTLLLQQLKASLGNKAEEDPNKALLRALVTAQNKTPSSTGASTLKSDVLNRLLGDKVEGDKTMAEWLATLNKQEEGESQFTLFRNHLHNKDPTGPEGKDDIKGGTIKSGMLEKAATNIHRKEVWPQQNLGEDWAEDQVEFKQIRFEHLVAGESRTIERCTEPAQILGRLRLLHRIAYLKLRGFKWHMLRCMYAAILSSIETGECSWESNFDRFKTILYKRAITESRPNTGTTEKPEAAKRRFCRDYNRPEGCTKPSPHSVWSGSGITAVKKLVYHYCASCLIKDKKPREHPDGHPECPHRA